MEGRCRRCGEKLSLLQRLQGQDFCSAEHRVEFQREQEQMALARLQQTASSLKRATSTKAAPAFTTGARKAQPSPVLYELDEPVEEIARVQPERLAIAAPRTEADRNDRQDAPAPAAALPPRGDPPDGGFVSGGYCKGQFAVCASEFGECGFAAATPAAPALSVALRQDEERGQTTRMEPIRAEAVRGDVETLLVSRIAPILALVASGKPRSRLTVQPFNWAQVHRWLEQGPAPAGLVKGRAPLTRVWEPQPRAPEPGETSATISPGASCWLRPSARCAPAQEGGQVQIPPPGAARWNAAVALRSETREETNAPAPVLPLRQGPVASRSALSPVLATELHGIALPRAAQWEAAVALVHAIPAETNALAPAPPPWQRTANGPAAFRSDLSPVLATELHGIALPLAARWDAAVALVLAIPEETNAPVPLRTRRRGPVGGPEASRSDQSPGLATEQRRIALPRAIDWDAAVALVAATPEESNVPAPVPPRRQEPAGGRATPRPGLAPRLAIRCPASLGTPTPDLEPITAGMRPCAIVPWFAVEAARPRKSGEGVAASAIWPPMSASLPALPAAISNPRPRMGGKTPWFPVEAAAPAMYATEARFPGEPFSRQAVIGSSGLA